MVMLKWVFCFINTLAWRRHKGVNDTKYTCCSYIERLMKTLVSHSSDKAKTTGNRVTESRRILKKGWPGHLQGN
jgi:hypothetical protein